MRDRIFKLTPIHASVIFRLPEFTEFSESSVQLGKNPIGRLGNKVKFAKTSSSLTGNEPKT